MNQNILPTILRQVGAVDAVAVAVRDDPSAVLGALRLIETQNGVRVTPALVSTASTRTRREAQHFEALILLKSRIIVKPWTTICFQFRSENDGR